MANGGPIAGGDCFIVSASQARIGYGTEGERRAGEDCSAVFVVATGTKVANEAIGLGGCMVDVEKLGFAVCVAGSGDPSISARKSRSLVDRDLVRADLWRSGSMIVSVMMLDVGSGSFERP